MKAPSLKLVLLSALAVRATWFFVCLQRPSSDDLQYALMAEAIRSREAFPLVAWGIGYGGTITTSWVLAGLFALFGPSLPVVAAYGAALSLIQIFLWVGIARRLQPGSEGWVGLLLAVPPAHMGIMMQQLSYADSLIIGAAVVWCVVRWSKQATLSLKQSFILGALVGYLFYTHPIPVVFAAGLFLLRHNRVHVSISASFAGLLVGAAPLIAANLLARGITVRRIATRLLNMNAEQFSSNSSIGHLAGRIAGQFWVGLAAQPKLIAEAFSSDLGLTLLGIAAAAGWVVLLVYARRTSSAMRWIVWPIIIASLTGNALFGQNARARFLMPAYASSAVMAASGVALGGFPAQAVALSVIALNGAGTWSRTRSKPAGIPYQAAISYLKGQGAHYGYADFWQSLPLTFLSQGALQVASTATDALGFWDRTTHITNRADQAQDVFYVFDSSNPTQQLFIKAFDLLIDKEGIVCDRATLPPLRIYSRLSSPVRPQQLDAVFRLAGFSAQELH